MTIFFCSVFSLIELVRFVFTIPGVKSFLTQRICQDPLENFFGCQRQRGGAHDNPTVAEFEKNIQALRVINSFARGPATGNCRGFSNESIFFSHPVIIVPAKRTALAF